MNIYGTKPACKIYHDGLHRDLTQHVLSASSANPFLYMARAEAGVTYVAVTIHDFLILAPTTALLRQIRQILG